MAFFRSALALLLIVLTFSCASRETLDDRNRTESYQQTEQHFEFIEHTTFSAVGALYSMNDRFIGSCVLVSPLIALTAGHCIEYGDIKSARFGDEKILVESQFVHRDYYFGDDLGILILASPSKEKPMSIIDDIGIIGKMDPIYTIAHGEGRKKVSKDGVYNFYGILKNKPNEISFLPLQTSVWFGDSGGALVWKNENDEYVLIGIITHFSVLDDMVYECAARRVDNFDIYDNLWHLWITK